MTEEQCQQRLQDFCNLTNSTLNANQCQCKDCSCSLNYGQDMNCCFEEMDTVKRAEQEGLVCTMMIVGVQTDSNLQGLYTISSCPENNNTDCGSERVAAWGSLVPVYSPARERVYRNKHCAQCHHVGDAVDMQTQIICQDRSRASISMEEVLLAIETWFEEQSYCSVTFTLPDEAMNVSRRNLQCFPNITRRCQTFDFSAPGETEHMCRNGPLMPITFRARSGPLWWYGNVFCAFCNGIKYVRSCQHPSLEYTTVENSPLSQMSSMNSFALLLSLNEVMMAQQQSDSQKNLMLVCATKTEETACRPVFCPVLQRKQPDSTCGPLVVDVVGQYYEICLNFSLTPGMEVGRFLKLCEKVDSSNKRFPANFRSPWARSWKVKDEVYYHIEKGMWLSTLFEEKKSRLGASKDSRKYRKNNKNALDCR